MKEKFVLSQKLSKEIKVGPNIKLRSKRQRTWEVRNKDSCSIQKNTGEFILSTNQRG